MTKKQLKILIRECLNEVQSEQFDDLAVTATVTGSDISQLKKFIFKLHGILSDEFDEDVVIMSKPLVSNQNKKIESKFKITSVMSTEDVEIIKETLQDIQQKLELWSTQKGMTLNFDLKIEN